MTIDPIENARIRAELELLELGHEVVIGIARAMDPGSIPALIKRKHRTHNLILEGYSLEKAHTITCQEFIQTHY